jgi:hypothetical protein
MMEQIDIPYKRYLNEWYYRVPSPAISKIQFPGNILNRLFQFLPCFKLNGIGCLDLDCLAGEDVQNSVSVN